MSDPNINIIYGEGDDEALPEDLYYREITARISRLNENSEDIENLHQIIPDSFPQQGRNRPEIIPEPNFFQTEEKKEENNKKEEKQSEFDHSDTLYGANTNTYTTDDNTTYLNPSLLSTGGNNKKSSSGGGCGNDCGCDEEENKINEEKNAKSDGCGDCGCDEAPPLKKSGGGCGSGSGSGDCGCDDNEEKQQRGKDGCGSNDCGCDDTKDSSSTSSTSCCSSTKPSGTTDKNHEYQGRRGDNHHDHDHNTVQSFGNYADILKPGQNPQNNKAPIKASIVGENYDIAFSDEKNQDNDDEGISNIPGLGTIWIKTWGCSHNTSDGEYMAGLLSQAGYNITNNENEAQIWICNSCSVKGPSEQSFFNELKRGRSLGKGVIVAGCVPQAHPDHPQLATFSGKAKMMSGMHLKKLKKQKILLEQQGAEMLKTGEKKNEEEVKKFILEEQEKYKNILIEEHRKNTTLFVNQGLDIDSLEDESTPYSGVVSVLGTDNIHRVVEVVEATLQGNSLSLLANPQRHRPANDLALPKIRKNPFVEIISINTGCLNNCTYCKTKHARGTLRSYPIIEIVERVRTSLSEGVIEIWLTSEDLGAYGIDIGVRVHDLVTEILKIMTPGTMLRMGMSNPPYFKDILEPMYDIFKNKNCYEFLHIPVQAGADPVLNEMRRDYTNYEFQTICDELLKNIPTLTLATDFICGFPTETDEDWKLSVHLVEKYKFPVVFINQFYPRPGTPAYALPQLPAATLKARSKELVTLFNSYNTRTGREGEEWEVLVTDMSRDGEYMVAHTKRYDQVLIPSHDEIMGKKIKVKIVQAEKHYLYAEILPGAIEEANKIPTILPLNYKYWQFSKFIDSNIKNFISPSTSSTSSSSQIQSQSSPQNLPNLQVIGSKKTASQSTTTPATNKGGIDDDEDEFPIKKRVQTSTTPTTTTTQTTPTATTTTTPPTTIQPKQESIPAASSSTVTVPTTTQTTIQQTKTSPSTSSLVANSSKTTVVQQNDSQLMIVLSIIGVLLAVLLARRF